MLDVQAARRRASADRGARAARAAAPASVTFDRAPPAAPTPPSSTTCRPARCRRTISAGPKTYAARLAIGARRPRSGARAAAGRGRGTVAAGEAADMAVGLQRVGRRTSPACLPDRGRRRIPAGRRWRWWDGHPAVPCAATVTVCFTAPVPPGAVRRCRWLSGGRAATRCMPRSTWRPVAPPRRRRSSGAPATALRSAAVGRDRQCAHLRSRPLRAQHLGRQPSRPARPLRQLGGAQSRIIGAERWDRNSPTGTWQKHSSTPVKVPDPYWVAGRDGGGYVVGGTPSNGGRDAGAVRRRGPVFYRLDIDRQHRPGAAAAHGHGGALHARSATGTSTRAPPVTPPTG